MSPPPRQNFRQPFLCQSVLNKVDFSVKASARRRESTMYFPRLPIIADGSRRSAVFRPSRATTIIAVGFLLLFYLHHFFSARVSSSRDIHARSVTPYNDNNRHVHSQKVFDDPTPLSTFLCRHGLDNDETVFLTIASKEYMPQTLNFKASLKRWKLDRRYAVLCLDVECLSVSKENGIVAYDGYIMSPEEAKGNWHVPVARLKVPSSSLCSQLLPTPEHG